MAKQKKKKKTAAYAQTKRMISPKDSRIKKPQLNPNLAAKLAKQKADDAVRSVAQTPSGSSLRTTSRSARLITS